MRSLLCAACILAALLPAGCDKAKSAMNAAGAAAKKAGAQISDQASNIVESSKDAVDTAVQKAQGAVDAAADAVDHDGSVSLNIGTDLSLSACYATFVPPVGGRSSLLQLRSYQTAGKPEYPAAFIHAAVPVASVNELAGKTLQARVFLQDASGNLWDNVDQGMLTLLVDSVDKDGLAVRVQAGQLLNVKTGETADVTGSAVAVLTQ